MPALEHWKQYLRKEFSEDVHAHERVTVPVDQSHDSYHAEKFIITVIAVTEIVDLLRFDFLPTFGAFALFERTFVLSLDGKEQTVMQLLPQLRQRNLAIRRLPWDINALDSQLTTRSVSDILFL